MTVAQYADHMLILVLALVVASFVCGSWYRQHRQLQCTQANIDAIWGLVDDNPLLGTNTLAQVTLFNQIMLVALDQASDSLWPRLQAKASRMHTVVSLAPEITVADACVTERDLKQFRNLRVRLAAC